MLPAWKHRLLTTGPPGKSLDSISLPSLLSKDFDDKHPVFNFASGFLKMNKNEFEPIFPLIINDMHRMLFPFPCSTKIEYVSSLSPNS